MSSLIIGNLISIIGLTNTSIFFDEVSRNNEYVLNIIASISYLSLTSLYNKHNLQKEIESVEDSDESLLDSSSNLEILNIFKSSAKNSEFIFSENFNYEIEETFSLEKLNSLLESFRSVYTKVEEVSSLNDYEIYKDGKVFLKVTETVHEILSTIESFLDLYFQLEDLILKELTSEESLESRSMFRLFENVLEQLENLSSTSVSEISSFLKKRVKVKFRIIKKSKVYSNKRVKVLVSEMKKELEERREFGRECLEMVQRALKGETGVLEEFNSKRKMSGVYLASECEIHEKMRKMAPLVKRFLKNLLSSLKIEAEGENVLKCLEQVADIMTYSTIELTNFSTIFKVVLLKKVEEKLIEEGVIERESFKGRAIQSLKLFVDYLPVEFITILISIFLNANLGLVLRTYMEKAINYIKNE